MPVDIGDHFQRKTKHTREKLIGGYLDWPNKPDTYKTYPKSKIIRLTSDFSGQSLFFSDLLRSRRSVRSFSQKPVELSDLAFLLWASTGIQRKENGYEFRTVPSAGALYPIETYILANNVVDLEKGIYHYNMGALALEELSTADLGKKWFVRLWTRTCVQEHQLSSFGRRFFKGQNGNMPKGHTGMCTWTVGTLRRTFR